MTPILYSSITEGTVPSHYGVGALTDCLSCEVTEERNGSYELTMTYAAEGIHASDIEPNKFIKAKPNLTDDPQLFRIYKVGKTINGTFTVYAQHISYDLSGKLITSGTATSCATACTLLKAQAGNFNITTDKTISKAFVITEPSSVRSWFGGKEGSILDIYGPGEWKYDNYTASFKTNRGQDRGVQIRYGKNLTELSQELDMSNLCTGVVPYYIDQDGNKTVGTKVTTGLVLDVSRDIAVDFSQSVNPDSATPITTQLATLANSYVNNNNLTTILNSITLSFVQLSTLQERVDLCDTVHIYFEALGISASAKCIATTWDVLEERYTSTTFGEARTSIVDTIATTQKEASEAINKSYMDIAIQHATELITGNLGGYCIIHDSNNDGTPDEILIMNTADINTATKVWRWNKNGLGYSSNGYAGPYGLAMTADGAIVADYITTGTLNAGLIKAGILEDFQGNSSINMTTGEAKLNDMKAKNTFTLIDSSNNTRAYIGYSGAQGTIIRAVNSNGDAVATLDAQSDGKGLLAIYNSDGDQVGTISSDVSKNGRFYLNNFAGIQMIILESTTYGSALTLKNHSGTTNVNIFTGASGDGTVNVCDSSGSWTTNIAGESGVITCVAVQQTSSRKVKKNIKPIKDARKILELEAVQFDYKDANRGKNKRGFIAEDVATVLPNLVSPETEEKPATLDYIQMIPYLQEIIKEQDRRIKALEDKLNGAN